MINLEQATYSWQIIAGLVTLVAWFIRLESKVLYIEKELGEHKRLAAERDAQVGVKLDNLQLTMTTIAQSIAKIEGKLESNRGDL